VQYCSCWVLGCPRQQQTAAVRPNPHLCRRSSIASNKPTFPRTPSHHTSVNDDISLWAAKTGPFTNPSETYEYYMLPYCKPKGGVKWKTLGMGEVGAAWIGGCLAGVQRGQVVAERLCRPLPAARNRAGSSCSSPTATPTETPTERPPPQVVDANRMASTPYDLSFRVERANQTICKKTLSSDDLEKFRDVSNGRLE
jgi:hypothetical protein